MNYCSLPCGGYKSEVKVSQDHTPEGDWEWSISGLVVPNLWERLDSGCATLTFTPGSPYLCASVRV